MPDRPCVLLICDTPAAGFELRGALDGLPVRLVEATTPEAAAEALGPRDAAVILFDGRRAASPASDGVRRLRAMARTRMVPILFLTADCADAAEAEALSALGAVELLPPDVPPALLRAKVRGHVALFAEADPARRESEQLRLIVQGTKDYAIFMIDPQGRIATWNAGARLLKGYSEEEIVGRHLSTFYPPEVAASGWVEHELQVAAETGRFEDEGWRVRKDGSRFWANVVITALYSDDGELRGFSKVTRDLTARREAEEASRKLAEEAVARQAAEAQARLLAEQRERLRVTLTSIGDAVITTDREARVEFMNPIAETLTGWNAAEAAGRPLTEVFRIINEDTRQAVENPALRCLQEGIIVGLANHTLLVARDGRERPIDDSAAPIRDTQARIVGSVLVFRDVGARRAADRQRNARSAATQALAVAATAAEGVQAVLSAICAQMHWEAGLFWSLDAARGVLVCRGAWSRDDAHLRRFLDDSRTRAFAAGDGLPGRVWSTRRSAWIIDVAQEDGFPRRAPALAAGLHSAFACPVVVGGDPVGVIEFFTRRMEEPDAALLEMVSTLAGTVGQFLQRRNVERALREQTQNAEALVRVSRLLAQETDLQTLVQVVTDEATRLCGAQFGAFFYNVANEAGESYTLFTLSGLPREAFAGFPMPRNTAVFGPTFTGRDVVRLDDVTQDARYGHNPPYRGMPDGYPPVKSYLAASVVSRSGQVHGGLFFGHPQAGVFTERHERLIAAVANQAAVAIDNAELYEALRQADRRKDEFLATLAHELRNPLAPIRNGLNVLRLAGSDEPAAKQTRAMMERQLGHLVRLVDDLLDVSRITRNRLELRREVVTLAEVLHSAIETSRPVVQQFEHALEVSLPEAPVHLEADRVRLAQVFANLLNNAAKYTPAGGRISLRAAVEEGQAVVRVRDDGLGIPPQALSRIFDMFAQVDRDTPAAQGGLGIGLSLARRLVELHDGRIEAHSEGSGHGSEFVVRLPLHAAPASSTGAPAPAGGPGTAARRVLVVDDNQDAAESLRMMLMLMGHEVRTALDGPQALVQAREFRPQMVLLDIGLPTMSGYEVCRAMREEAWSQGVPIVALTGWGQESDRRRSREAGFDRHLVKPVEMEALLALVSGGA